jgi:AraC-like DNA-binding protein
MIPAETKNESRISVRLLWPLARMPAFGETLLELCSRFDVSARDFADPDVRVQHRLLLRALELGVRSTEDPLFGLHAGARMEPFDFDVVEYAARSKHTLRDALSTLVRFARLLHGGCDLELVEVGSETELRIRITDDGAHPPSAHEFLVAAMTAFLRRNSAPPTQPLRIAFEHQRPASAAFYRLGAELVFGARCDAIVLRTADLSAPTPWPNCEIARAFEREAEKLGERLAASDDRLGQVPELVARLFESGSVTMAEAARRLEMSVATLRRRIRKHGTTFNEIANAERRKLAERYLSRANPSIGEIAFLLGFKNPSAFSRAFRKWRGLSPSEYRLGGGLHRVAAPEDR